MNYYALSTGCTGNGGVDRAGCHAAVESVGGGGGGAGGGLAEAVPPLDLYIWDDKGVWLAEIFFRV